MDNPLDLSSIVLRPSMTQTKKLTLPQDGPSLRRSPRKHQSRTTNTCILTDAPILSATSQQRLSPQKASSPQRVPLKPIQSKQQKVQDVPVLGKVQMSQRSRAGPTLLSFVEDTSSDESTLPVSKLDLQKDRASKPTSTMSRITQATGTQTRTRGKVTNPYVSKEAHCDDLNESSGTDNDEEDEETDLSGFIVDDDAEPDFDGSAIEISSDSEVEAKKSKEKKPVQRTKRLVRGRRIIESDDEDDLSLSRALDGMKLGEKVLQRQTIAKKKTSIEIVDLTSSPLQRPTTPQRDEHEESDLENELPDRASGLVDPFLSNNMALTLQPSQPALPQLVPSKNGPVMMSPKRVDKTERPRTPTATPPQSPTKLKSPKKLLSPTKRPDNAKSPHRQSMAGFWDAEVVNEWHDTFSPRKAPTLSPRKNPLSRFNIFADELSSSDAESQPTVASSQDLLDESSDSLPSPCESPVKSRSPSKVSALKAQQMRIRDEKKAKLAAKKKFDAEKEKMATDLLLALDQNVTGSKISTMAASTGGIEVVWSKTLRSTAGRANWRRTVTKTSGSPVKGKPESQSGVVVKHFASIELAGKIIDRPERLVNTLAHEFCHLANFMVSDIRDQPHGESFKQWGRKVTTWLKSSNARDAAGYRSDWRLVEVTTKHSYVVETKYLWVCTGRPAGKQTQTLTQKMLDIEPEDEDGCGAEYGRHSKSIDTEKQRCGRCKGFLVQVRPAPRAPSSPRKSPAKRAAKIDDSSQDSVESLEEMMGGVRLRD